MIAFFEQLKKCQQVIECTKCDIARVQNETFCMRAAFSVYYVLITPRYKALLASLGANGKHVKCSGLFL